MKEQIPESLKIAREEYKKLARELDIHYWKSSPFTPEVKEHYLRGRVGDPDIVANIGTPNFFRETALTVWRLHQEFLTEPEKRVGEGNLNLLWNLMRVNGEIETIPSKEDIFAWADNSGIMIPLTENLMIAGGYGIPSEMLMNYYDEEAYRKMVGEKSSARSIGSWSMVKIYSSMYARDITSLALHILSRIKRK